jgi:hypothetical protein
MIESKCEGFSLDSLWALHFSITALSQMTYLRLVRQGHTGKYSQINKGLQLFGFSVPWPHTRPDDLFYGKVNTSIDNQQEYLTAIKYVIAHIVIRYAQNAR